MTVNTGDTVVEEGTVLEKRAPDLTSDCTAASWKDPAWGHPGKDRKMRINEGDLTAKQIIKTTAVKHTFKNANLLNAHLNSFLKSKRKKAARLEEINLVSGLSTRPETEFSVSISSKPKFICESTRKRAALFLLLGGPVITQKQKQVCFLLL